MSGKFVRNTLYYSGVVYEWNLPTGSSCPFAMECKVILDRNTGIKFALLDNMKVSKKESADEFNDRFIHLNTFRTSFN